MQRYRLTTSGVCDCMVPDSSGAWVKHDDAVKIVAGKIACAERFTAEQCCQIIADKLYNGCIIGAAAVIKEKFGL